MTIPNDTIDHIARLSHLKLSDQDKIRLAKNLGNIITFIDQVNAYEIPNPQASHTQEASQPLRPDEPFRSDLERDLIQQNAPAAEEGLYLVPDVIETSSE